MFGDWLSKRIWFMDIMWYTQPSSEYSPSAAMHISQRKYSCWKHSWKPFDEMAFITATSCLNLRYTFETASFENIVEDLLSNRKPAETCAMFLSATSPTAGRIWYPQVFLQTSFRLSENSNDHSSLTCIVWKNPALRNVIFSSHVPLRYGKIVPPSPNSGWRYQQSLWLFSS